MGNGGSTEVERVVVDSRTSLTREFRVATHAPRAERAAVRAYLRKAGGRSEASSEGENVSVNGGKSARRLAFEPEGEVDSYEDEEESIALSFDEPSVVPKKMFDRHELAQQRELYPDAVSVTSFNVLANKYVSNPREKDLYSHCPKQYLGWPYRVRLILRSLGETDADIICLQEVEADAYETDFKPVFKARGYVCLYHNDMIKRKNEQSPLEIPGQAMFVKKKGWELKWEIQSYRALVGAFEISDAKHPFHGKVLTVVNVHLEGHPKRHKERASQLRSVLKKLWKRQEEWDYSIVCGDFNTPLTDPECACVQVLQKYRYLSVYKTDCLEDPTCILTPWNDPNEKRAVHVDHIFYTAKQFTRRGVTRIIDTSWNRNMVLIEGLPSKAWPSDHFSIAAILELKQINGKTKAKAKQTTKGEAAKVPKEPKDLLALRLKEVKKVLNPEEFARWSELQEPEHSGGKLTEEDIAERRERSSKRQTFVGGLEENKQAAIKAYANAQKEMKKSTKAKKKTKQ